MEEIWAFIWHGTNSTGGAHVSTGSTGNQSPLLWFPSRVCLGQRTWTLAGESSPSPQCSEQQTLLASARVVGERGVGAAVDSTGGLVVRPVETQGKRQALCDPGGLFPRENLASLSPRLRSPGLYSHEGGCGFPKLWSGAGGCQLHN